MKRETYQVAIVGAGPAGLGAAIELKRRGVTGIVVIDREEAGGGMPRFCDHIGFGLKDLHMLYTGPGYARNYVRRAEQAGIEIRTSTTVTGWNGTTTLALTCPHGLEEIEAKAVLLATGCRERPRSARLIPGARPAGVFTTGSMQQLIHVYHQPVGKKVVIVGAEIVSFSALLSLASTRGAVAAMITDLPHHQLYWPYAPGKLLLADTWMRTPIMTSTRLNRILGRKRVEAVEVVSASGQTKVIDCDAVVLSGDWIPQNELARSGGLALDPGTRGPRVDAYLRTSAPGVFAAGNLLRGVETHDRASREGRLAAACIGSYLEHGGWPDDTLPVQVVDPILWVSPNAVSSDGSDAPLGRMLLRVKAEQRDAVVQVRQGERLLHSQHFARLRPNTSESLAGDWLKEVEPRGLPVRVNIG
jgi:thioredoxin reductase